ncbi:hypothetical protein GII32_10665 [Gordonia amarae]|uniref:hypothetical protein n=1 Tax=Gordonia amarae TaxID=36821 RepID=UPI001AF45E46|nr:hypothetical protein [Gordonia amarae]QHN30781.1 hypothetical protein GII32_10665 [Gordonia amarae]
MTTTPSTDPLGALVTRVLLAAGAGDRAQVERIVLEAADAADRIIWALATALADRLPADALLAMATRHADAAAGGPPMGEPTDPRDDAPAVNSAPERIPVRATSAHSHRVAGQGDHDHHRFATDDGTVVEVARWPRHPHLPAFVRTLGAGGEVLTEARHSGLLGVGALLRLEGFEPV